jgi:hypothetical protein
MSEFSEIKKDFRRLLVEQGIDSPAHDLVAGLPVPPALLQQWMSRFYQLPDLGLLGGRLVNHFKLGADPEFVFLSMSEMARKDASNFGLAAGVAFGADNCGRIAELRPHPSCSALAVVASLQSTLKWLAIHTPVTMNYIWRCGAFVEGDSLGGHIHFGRLQFDKQLRESAALDAVMYWLTRLGVYDNAEGRQRIKGGHYGRLADRRKQKHGYEYRTPPSWLDSPWMALFYLTLAKLAVHNPSLIQPLSKEMEGWPASAFRRRVAALLAYYKGLDDDSALAYHILQTQGLPQRVTGDFRPHWGINPGLENAVRFNVLPDTIPPLPQEIEEIRESLLAHRPPGIVSLEPTWRPFQLPPGYIHTITQCNTYARPGVGELARRLVHHSEWPLYLEVIGEEGGIVVSSGLAARLGFQVTGALKQFGLAAVSIPRKDNNFIGFSKWDYQQQPELLYALLVESGCFPIWDLQKVTSNSLKEWEAHRVELAAKFPYVEGAGVVTRSKGCTVLYEY